MSDTEPKPACEPDVAGMLASHHGWLRSVIIARLGEASAADDVLQEVNVAAIEQKSPVRNEGSIAAWLYQLAVWQVLQFRRRSGRQRKRLNDAASVERTKQVKTGDPLVWLLSTERRELVREALTALSGEDRELLILKYIEGWTYQQIAERTGRTISSVESQLHRARARLREELYRRDVVERDKS